jgi:hypothetical protein
MEKFTNSLNDSQSFIPSLTYGQTTTDINTNNNFDTLGDSIKNISPITWLIIIFLLSFLGFNIFIYLAKGTQGVTDFFSPIVGKISSVFGVLTGQVVSVSAEGSKGIVSTASQGTQEIVGGTADIVNTGLSKIQEVAQPNQTSTQGQSVNIQQPDIMQSNTLNRALNTSTSQKQQVNGEDYQADDSTSSIQMSSTTGKSGWCYIGEERGYRTCAEVGVNDTCMSGDIFPSQQICVNPNLRA